LAGRRGSQGRTCHASGTHAPTGEPCRTLTQTLNSMGGQGARAHMVAAGAALPSAADEGWHEPRDRLFPISVLLVPCNMRCLLCCV
jgi:hypothetical protein